MVIMRRYDNMEGIITTETDMPRNRTQWQLTKGCSKCGQTDPHEFYGTSAWCKRCHKDAVLKSRLAKKGITLEDEARMAEAQGHRCAICLDPRDKDTRSMHMDHDHATGKARGMLCPRCNQTLGRVKDDVSLLRSMIEYIERHR